MFFSGANGAMQGTNYSTGSRDDPAADRSLDAAACGRSRARSSTVYDFNPGYRRSDHEGQAVVVRHGAVDRGRELRARKIIPTRTSSSADAATLLNTQTMTYTPDTTPGLADGWGGGGDFWEQTLRLSWQATHEEQDRRLLQQQEAARYTNGGATPGRTKSWRPRYFFPFSDQLVQWSSPVSNKLLLEAGFWHHQETWGMTSRPSTSSTRWRSV